MAIGELAILDGRYQLIRQMGGPPRTPLMVATDLKTGKVVCLRLQQFTTSIANLAAVPPLALDSVTVGDGPLLPFDFGVDEGMTYLVRDFVTGAPLEQLLGAPTHLPPVEIVSIFRRAGEALLVGMEQGFRHPGLALRHLLVTTDGAVRVAGYDAVHRERRQPQGSESEMLAVLVQQALAGPRLDTLPAAARALLLRIQTWQATTVPPLETVVRQLRRAEDRMRGYSRGRAVVVTGVHALGAIVRRFRHLGPLLHPYFFVLALVVGMVLLALHVLSSPARPGRLYVYPVPTRASIADAQDFTVTPPQVIVVATAATAATTAIRNTSNAVTIVSPDRPAATTTAASARSDASAVPQRQAAFQATAPSIPQRVVQQQVVATSFRPIQVRPRVQAVAAAQVTTREPVTSVVRGTVSATATTATGAMSIERAASTVRARITTSSAVSQSVVTASVITSHVTFIPATTDQVAVVATVVQTAGRAATPVRATTATAQTSDVSTRRTTASSVGAAASTVRSMATTESSRVAGTVRSAVTAAITGGPAQR